MTNDLLKLLHDTIAQADKKEPARIEVANLILEEKGKTLRVSKHADALMVLRALEGELLEADNYMGALTLLLGEDVFNTAPECVSSVIHAITKHHKLLLQGAGGISKTYSASAWHYADWRRDPWATTIKVAANNEDHLRTNVFASIISFHRCAQEIIPMEGEISMTDLSLGLKEAGDEFGFSGVAFNKNHMGGGQFRGFHPKPVKRWHPIWGNHSRIRILGDESGDWSTGPFNDFGSVLSSADEIGSVKITLCYNPKSISLPVVIQAEPEHGWLLSDLETLYEWKSKKNWHVLRLDASKLENVVQRKVVFKGFQTYQGYLDNLNENGDNGEKYYWACRGWPPIQGAANSVIPSTWVQDQRGEAEFIGKVKHCASVDLAYMGVDKCILTISRWGKARSWRKQSGEYVLFRNRLTQTPQPRFILQLDQIIELQKSDDTIQTAEEIMGYCKTALIEPDNVVVDMSGSGLGTYSHLSKYWGNVLGIQWGEKATDGKVLAEDKLPASAQYDGISTEMWFAFRRWLDPVVGAVLFGPNINPSPLNTELTSRRYRYAKGGRVKVESKEEYKARNQVSPDRADSVIEAVMLVRQRFGVLPGIVEQNDRESEYDEAKPQSLETADEVNALDTGHSGMGHLDNE